MRGLTPICKVTPESLPHLLRALHPLGVKWSNRFAAYGHILSLFGVPLTCALYASISLHIEFGPWGSKVLTILPHVLRPEIGYKDWIHNPYESCTLADFVRKARRVKQYEIR